MLTDEMVPYENTSICTALVPVNKPRKEKWCRYCEKWMPTRGFDAHVHFRHTAQVLAEFRWTMVRNFADVFYEANEGVRDAYETGHLL